MKISHRLWLIIAFAVTGICVVLVLGLFDLKAQMFSDRETKTRHVVEVAHGIVNHYANEASQGRITEAQAQESAKAAIKQVRYNGNEYFWIHDQTAPYPKMVMHTTSPDLDGQSLEDAKFNKATGIRIHKSTDFIKPSSNNLFVAMNEVVKRGGEGSVIYDWPKPKEGGGVTDSLYQKVSYVKGAPWGWVLGSGIYIDDIDAAFWKAALGGTLVGLLIITVFVIVVSMDIRKVIAALNRAREVAQSVAEGDLTCTIATDRHDEIGELLKSLDRMRSALAKTVTEIRQASDGISVASSEIAQGNEDLACRTEEAASSLEQTAASMEQLNSTVRNSAEGALQATDLASDASDIALRGGQVVSQVVVTMEQINAGSKKIRDIIGVIDGIAFQTNILALNAAVEAARAGEQGRGFAVVATEVRNLAQRSAAAAKEIKMLIEASVDEVGAGARLVEDAGQTMEEIVCAIQKVKDIVCEMSTAAREESDGIGQINTAVTQLDQMTQQNSALVEESAAMAQSLRDEAQHMVQLVSAFRVER